MLSSFSFKYKITLFIICVIAIGTTSAQKSSFKSGKNITNAPIIQLEKRHFQVNENVVISGEGFETFEQISVVIKEVNASSESILANWIVYADSKGKSVFNWRVPFQGNFEIIALANKTGLEVRTTISSLVPTPVVVAGSPVCDDLNGLPNPEFAHITSDWGFRLDFANPNGTFPFVDSAGPMPTELTGGAPADPNNTVSAATTNGGLDLAWTSTKVITAVIVKGSGPNSNAYPYNPAVGGDPGPLTTPDGSAITYVEFCSEPQARITIIKHATPPSTYQFNFTASPGLSPSAFSLTDNDISTDPVQVFPVLDFNVKTITETNPGPYTLASINCTVDVGTGGTPAPVRTGNSINIDIKSGDQVTCTFNNDFVTAAAVRISGQVFNPAGNGLGRAMVSMTDANGNVRTVMTNHFGYFKFDNVDSGDSYLFNVQHKSYIFAPQLIEVTDEISNLRFFPSQ